MVGVRSGKIIPFGNADSGSRYYKKGLQNSGTSLPGPGRAACQSNHRPTHPSRRDAAVPSLAASIPARDFYKDGPGSKRRFNADKG
jgi:hypothetical protein